ncbi:hypothetical protein ACHAWC_002386 [Mediolabrus comicus]
MPLIRDGKISVAIPPQRAGWKSFQFNIHNFAAMNVPKSDFCLTPPFSCNGHQWVLIIHPCGCSQVMDGWMSIYLMNISERCISATYQMEMLNKFFGGVDHTSPQVSDHFFLTKRNHIALTFERCRIWDLSHNILDDNGTSSVVISMKEHGQGKEYPPALKPFIPKNPCQNMLQKKFLDEKTSDVCFEVSSSDSNNDRSKKTKASDLFHAHRSILEICAPMLAALLPPRPDGELAKASITDVKPDIFRYLLFYVYGGSVPEEVLKQRAKEIIETADKYSIVCLKLEAEALYVESTDITMENAIDNLLYADAKNCALLKETVLDFLAENSVEAGQNISFSDLPSHMFNDLLVAFGRRDKSDISENNNDKYSTMRVSELRRMLDEKGLDVDGPREAMIEALKSSAII